MMPDVISALGGTKVFGARAPRVDLIEETERGLPVRAYAFRRVWEPALVGKSAHDLMRPPLIASYAWHASLH